MVRKDFTPLTPNVMTKNITSLNYKRMKQLGLETIIFDKDNTLTSPGEINFYNEDI